MAVGVAPIRRSALWSSVVAVAIAALIAADTGGGYGGRGYGGGSVGVYFGAPLGWGWPWGPPVYYPQPVYPPVINVPPPVVYVEREQVSAAASGQALEPGYWYYCRELAAYYPVVTQCPGTWEQVAPRAE